MKNKTASEIARANGLLLHITGVTVAGFPYERSKGGKPFCAGLIVGERGAPMFGNLWKKKAADIVTFCRKQGWVVRVADHHQREA